MICNVTKPRVLVLSLIFMFSCVLFKEFIELYVPILIYFVCLMYSIYKLQLSFVQSTSKCLYLIVHTQCDEENKNELEKVQTCLIAVFCYG